MYGDFGDHAAIKTTAQKVQQIKAIVEDQIKEASNQMMAENGNSNEVITHLTDSLATGEEDIVFAQNKIKSRTTSLSKEAVRYESQDDSCDSNKVFEETTTTKVEMNQKTKKDSKKTKEG